MGEEIPLADKIDWFLAGVGGGVWGDDRGPDWLARPRRRRQPQITPITAVTSCVHGTHSSKRQSGPPPSSEREVRRLGAS
jgi:hypothetical protein